MRWGKIALVTLALATTACTAAPTPPPERPRPTLTPLRYSNAPLWTYQGARNVELRGGLVLFNHGDQRLLLADVASGTPRWEFAKGHELRDGAHYQESFVPGPGVRHLVGSGETLGVLVEHETGLARVSAKDGSVTWQTSVLDPGTAGTGGETLTLRAVDDRIAVMSITEGPPNRPGYTGAPVRSVGLDVGTGTRVWESYDDVWPSLIAGGMVLGQETRGLPAQTATGRLPDGTVVGLDLLTGARRWDLTDRFTRSSLVLANQDVAVVTGVTAVTPDRRETVVVSVDTGKELASFPTGAVSCRGDRRTLVACVSDDDPRYALYTYTSGEQSVRTAAEGPAQGVRLHTVLAGRIVLGIRSGGGATRWRTLDAAGNTLDTTLDPPGPVRAITDDHAVLQTGPAGEIGIYEISG